MPSKVEFEKVCKELGKRDSIQGKPLTFEMIGRVFGQDFWELLVYALLDSNDAARAIAGAINRLRAGEQVEGN